MSTRRVVGLTGGIGTGKTTAARILADLGATIIDCDQLGRDVAAVGGGAYQGMVDRFGPDIVNDDRTIDRAALGAVVFNDAAALSDLNAITHPAIDAEIAKGIAAAPDGATVVLDMAVLVESDLGKGLYDEVLVIESPRSIRLARLLEQRGMAADDAESRMASQASDDDRRAIADAVIVNDAGLDDLRTRLIGWWNRTN